MGGQVITPNQGYVINMKYFNQMQFNANTDTITVQSGSKWSKIIKYLNHKDIRMSPDVLQSFCSFSVGGSISVNAHGITSDYALYNSIVSINVLTIDENLKINKLLCTRYNENKELFSLVIGGYGQFGVMLDVKLKCVPNRVVIPRQLRCTPDTFLTEYEKLLKDDQINIKLCRINIQTWNEIYLYIMGNKNNDKVSSNLPDKPLGIVFMFYSYSYKAHIVDKLQLNLNRNGIFQ